MSTITSSRKRQFILAAGLGLVAVILIVGAVSFFPTSKEPVPNIPYRPRQLLDSSGFGLIANLVQRWSPNDSLAEISATFQGEAQRQINLLQGQISSPMVPDDSRIDAALAVAILHNSEGEPALGYECLQVARTIAEADPKLAIKWRYTIIFQQGIASLRRGENENCIMCRGESSCIMPIAAAAVHTNPSGSRQAIKHFTEYLEVFPEDLEVRWLLNLAHMTLGEHPQGVDPRFLISLDRLRHSEFDIGRFRDVGHTLGVNRFNQAGGVVMDDFDNDGLLDLMCTTWDATEPAILFRNRGDGTFDDRSPTAGLSDQLGGLNLTQGDYNNDGYLDVFIPRGAWLQKGIRPSLMRNNGNGSFTDVTKEAGLMDPMNSNCAAWADFDNDGFLDLFICEEVTSNRLYRNKGDGTFEDVTTRAGVSGYRKMCKGATWIDYDNDRYPDLFVNYLNGQGQLYHNNRNGTFTLVSKPLGIDGPQAGFSCWAWDYDNDGWLDIFATCYDRALEDIAKGIMGEPHARHSNKLFRNLRGTGFKDVTKEVGLDMVFATMGSNFGDFDNDGFLDMYLGTGEPDLATLVPNRMFKNIGGKRFSEITGTSGMGHLQKGHGVACGDWDRDGNIDVFVMLGGAVNGDRFHNVLFQNPGQGNNWLTVKLIGQKSNRSAIGARIKAITTATPPQTIHRHVSSGSSFGGNPLQQTLGLAKADRVATLEIYWPTTNTTQVFHDIAVNQAIEITEFAKEYRKLDWKPVSMAK